MGFFFLESARSNDRAIFSLTGSNFELHLLKHRDDTMRAGTTVTLISTPKQVFDPSFQLTENIRSSRAFFRAFAIMAGLTLVGLAGYLGYAAMSESVLR